MAKFEITSYQGALVEDTRLYVDKLYLRQVWSGKTPNQTPVIEGDDTRKEYGRTLVNDWAIYDGLAPDAELVANGRGIHVNAVDWYNSFIMVFVNERFKGSTLEVMGATIGGKGEWAIVGGTGEFRMARGVIDRTYFDRTSDGEIMELTIEAFYRAKKSPTPRKMEDQPVEPAQPKFT
uniref:Uncharacterized protein n=1 Tax=Avena sativa TaxID=4498 RepID=A0ACD5WLU4_AVESA